MQEKRILIVDEAGFSRVCSSILESEGYDIDTITDKDNPNIQFNSKAFALIITSFPYGVFVLEAIRGKNIPTIILSDQIDKELTDKLNECDNSFCLIKPIDYKKFRILVRDVMSGNLGFHDGYSIY